MSDIAGSNPSSFNVKAWLDEEVEWRQFNGTVKVPRHERLCFLIYANGGLVVNGYGFISTGGGLHQEGLDQNDALALLWFEAFMCGLASAGVPIHDEFASLYYDDYRKKWDAKKEAMKTKIASVEADLDKLSASVDTSQSG